MHDIEVIPTCVPGNTADLMDVADRVAYFSPTLHIDVNDGEFARPKTWPHDLTDLGPVPPLELHVHAMVQDASSYGAALARFGAHTLIVHGESTFTHDDIARWEGLGIVEFGLAFLLDTSISDVLSRITEYEPDVVLLMSVASIGEQGAPFDSRVFDRIRAVKETHPNICIAVDGGISFDNIADLVRNGATRFYVGSSIMRTEGPAGNAEKLLATAKSAVQ